MNEKTPHAIKVDVQTAYVASESAPEHERYVFTYTITIRNEGSAAAQLLTRHWIITDANDQVQEVRGEGVVGKQPYLRPGEAFRYTSGSILQTPVGSMRGSYQMIDDSGQQFDANIPAFTLSKPGMLH